MVMFLESEKMKKKKTIRLGSKYLNNLLPHVFRTEGDVVKFNPQKIEESIIKETGLDAKSADKITEIVVRRIISSGIEFLSGPHIREIVCSVLSEQHCEEERKVYTRIGMPLMDYEEILEYGVNENANQELNPESIHHWASNRISEEYALLRILNSEEARAHLYGDIHVHMLRYFDLRPFCQEWDARMILENGLTPVDSWAHCNKSGPAGSLRVAVTHLAKWLGIMQGEFSGGLGFQHLTTFLAPYAMGLSKDDIKQGMQSLIYETNQLTAVIGRSLPNLSISTSPTILDYLEDVPAIGPYGKVKGVYGDYQDECRVLFNAITEVFRDGDYNERPFMCPHHLIHVKEKWIKEYNDEYEAVWEGINKMKTPYLVNLDADWLKLKKKDEAIETGFLNHGILQNISLNLPRMAFLSKDEGKFLEMIEDKMDLGARILRKKFTIIKKRLRTKHLPMCSGVVKGNKIFDLEKQFLSLSFVGLNEAITLLTQLEFHESKEALSLGLKIISRMKEICQQFSSNDDKKFILLEEPTSKASLRFTKLDKKHFTTMNDELSTLNGQNYANSCHFRIKPESFDMEHVIKQGEFHSIIQNGVVQGVPLKNVSEKWNGPKDFVLNACKDSKIGSFKFE